MATKVIDTYCQQCHMKCHVFCTVRAGQIESIAKTTCPKGYHAAINLYHPDRLRFPLKRVGERGEGRWQRISWDEALDLMATKFGEIAAKYGAEAVATTTGCFHKENAVSASFLFGYLLSTPNVLDANHQCTRTYTLAEQVTYGERLSGDSSCDYARSRCILLWGANVHHTRPVQAIQIVRAHRAGAKLIVVDPRPTTVATRADLWLRPRPGTDAALALALLNVIIRERLYAPDFVERWCVGFDKLRERVAEYTPAKASLITWIPEEQIVQTARLFATTKPACVHTRLGGGAQHVNGTQTGRAVSLLMALSGSIDVEGGNLLSSGLGGFKAVGTLPTHLSLAPEVIEGKRLGARDFPLACGPGQKLPSRNVAHTILGWQAMLQGKIKAFYIPGSNVVLNDGNSREVWRALQSLEFLTVVDFFLTPTAELADLVLPCAHWLETENPMNAWRDMGPDKYNYIMASQKVVEPPVECWDDRKIVLELAKRMGKASPWRRVEEFNDWRLAGTGVTFRQLQARPDHLLSFPIQYRKYEKAGFKTPSGKIELDSSLLAQAGYDPLPFFQEPPSSPVSTPEVAQEFPLILINFRHIAYEGTEYHQFAPLRKLYPDLRLEINPETARALGIAEGDAVWIERPGFSDRVKGRAQFVPGLHPKVVACLWGVWFPEKPGPEHGCFESNINTIISNEPPWDPINGNHHNRGLLCRIRKA